MGLSIPMSMSIMVVINNMGNLISSSGISILMSSRHCRMSNICWVILLLIIMMMMIVMASHMFRNFLTFDCSIIKRSDFLVSFWGRNRGHIFILVDMVVMDMVFFLLYLMCMRFNNMFVNYLCGSIVSSSFQSL